MNKQHEKILLDKFDYMFRERHLPMSQTCMCWLFECGDGWFDLIYKLCNDIQKELDKPQNIETKNNFCFAQVKEKFGLLRIYVNYSNEKINKLISIAENKSNKICMNCGKKGSLDKRFHWLITLCKECKKKRK